MQLSGTVGDSGMEGIKKIEQIYELLATPSPVVI
jgi:hypothetical protein